MDNNGCSKVEKKYKSNLLKGPDKFFIKVSTACTYRFNFNTTKGCSGNKDIRLHPDEAKKDKTHVYLDGACNINLKAKIRTIENRFLCGAAGSFGVKDQYSQCQETTDDSS